MIDFTFNNKLISDYFQGVGDYEPVSELIYLHEHPLVKDSFLVEIEKLINETSEYLVRRNMKGQVAENFISSAIKIGAELPNVTWQNAPTILKELRYIYKLCNKLLGKSKV